MAGNGFRLTLIACCGLMLASVALIAIGHALPVYTVPYDQASTLWENLCGADGYEPAARERYEALFGWHYALMNAGTTLALAGATALAIAAALRFTAATDTPWLRTPPHRWMFLAIGLCALALTAVGIVHGLYLDLQRQYFPVCADTIAIPIFGLYATLTLITPLLFLIGLGIALCFGQLPVPLTQWDASRPRHSWAVTLVFGAAMLAGTGMWLAGIFSSDQIAPSSVVILYLLAATRAALLAPRHTVPA